MNGSHFEFEGTFPCVVRAVCWQDIVDRCGAKVGYECFIRLAGVPDQNTRLAVSMIPSLVLNKVMSELLRHISLNCIKSPNPCKGKAFKIFLYVETHALLHANIVDELIEVYCCSRISGYELIIEVAGCQFSDNSLQQRYIDSLVRLKRAGVLVALGGGGILSDGWHIELELGLVSLVKLNISLIGISLNSLSLDIYCKTCEQLYELIHVYRVLLLAENVSTIWQSEKVLSLPFSYFQGYYFGKAYSAADGAMPSLDQAIIEAQPRQGLWVDVIV